MTGQNIAVFGIYPNHSSCEHAFSAFITVGFRDVDMSVLGQRNLEKNDRNTGIPANTLKGPAAAAVSGAAIGGALGWLAGTSSVAVPGLEQFFIAGPIVATLAGLAVGGTLASLAAALLELGLPERSQQVPVKNGKWGHTFIGTLCDFVFSPNSTTIIHFHGSGQRVLDK